MTKAVYRHRRDGRTLAALASRALGWSFLSTAVSRLGTMGIGIVLARLLGPGQFGDAAVAYVGLIAVLSFNELGVSLAIVRWPEEPGEIAPTTVSISVAMSVMLYGAVYGLAPYFAHVMHAPGAVGVVRVMGLIVVINGFVSTPAALMERYFSQGKKAIADQLHGWLSAALSAALAWAGFGAMSLAIGQAAGALAGGTLIIIFAPLPFRFGFDRVKARRLLKFGLPLAGSSIIVFLVANVDNFIAGKVLGATALGYYVLAWNLASWPLNMFSQPVRTVAPAVFSRLQSDPAAMRRAFASTAAVLGAVTLPICLLVSGSAVPLIGLIYGHAWLPAAQPLLWLAALGGLRILFELTYDYFVVLAKSRIVFMVQVAWLAALIPALIVGSHVDGVPGVAIAGLAVACVVVLPLYLIELRIVGVGPRALVAGLWLPLIAASGVGAAAMWVARTVPNYFVACAAAGLIAVAVIGLLLYRMRRTLAALRITLRGQEPASEESKPIQAQRSGGDAAPARREAQLEGLNLLIALSRPRPANLQGFPLTGPIPVLSDFAETSPIYRQTLAVKQARPVVTRQPPTVGDRDQDRMGP